MEKLLDKVLELMAILKPLTTRERRLIVEFLGRLVEVDADNWPEYYQKDAKK